MATPIFSTSSEETLQKTEIEILTEKRALCCGWNPAKHTRRLAVERCVLCVCFFHFSFSSFSLSLFFNSSSTTVVYFFEHSVHSKNYKVQQATLHTRGGILSAAKQVKQVNASMLYVIESTTTKNAEPGSMLKRGSWASYECAFRLLCRSFYTAHQCIGGGTTTNKGHVNTRSEVNETLPLGICAQSIGMRKYCTFFQRCACVHVCMCIYV